MKIGRADLHVHTDYSHDGLSGVCEIITAARQRELDVIAVTDHDTIEGALRARDFGLREGVDVIVGEEVSTRSGHVIGLFLDAPVPAGLPLEESIRRIHNQGGLAIIPHPLWRLHVGVELRTRGEIGFGGGVSRRSMRRVLQKERAARPDAVEIFNASPLNGRLPHREVVRLNREEWGLVEVGGSDAHHALHVGSGLTLFRGTSPEELRRSIEEGSTEGVGNYLGRAEVMAFVGGTIKKRAYAARSLGMRYFTR